MKKISVFVITMLFFISILAVNISGCAAVQVGAGLLNATNNSKKKDDGASKSKHWKPGANKWE
jgi:hypothetical protein